MGRKVEGKTIIIRSGSSVKRTLDILNIFGMNPERYNIGYLIFIAAKERKREDIFCSGNNYYIIKRDYKIFSQIYSILIKFLNNFF